MPVIRQHAHVSLRMATTSMLPGEGLLRRTGARTPSQTHPAKASHGSQGLLREPSPSGAKTTWWWQHGLASAWAGETSNRHWSRYTRR